LTVLLVASGTPAALLPLLDKEGNQLQASNLSVPTVLTGVCERV
jgi:hypothetical protein